MAQRTDVQYVQFFAQSNTAQRAMPSTRSYTHPLPRTKTRKAVRVYVDPVAILGTLVAICMLVMMLVGLGQLRTAQAKTATMTSYVEQLEVQNQQLKSEYVASCDLEAIEKTALALGMIPQEDAKHTQIVVEVP